ncbi:MAG TPA: hypothetical protein VEK35_01200 [Roseiarcus sp.]|nr:hypothetical protein [Roseiarcus sp.]
MTQEAPDPDLHYGNLISAYTDAIRVSDFKANLTVLFVAIMMGPVVASRDRFPAFLSLPLILAPFIVSFICLLFCVFPRYPRRETRNFIIAPNPKKSDFVFSDKDSDLEQLKLRCVILSGILFWKTLFLQVSFLICLISIAFTFVMLVYGLL